MMMHMYGVATSDSSPRAMFGSKAEADAARQPTEFVIEYRFAFEDSEVVTWPDAILIDLGGAA